MIISQTPYRISLFGGSTDYPQYYQNYSSTIIGFAIDQYCYITYRKSPCIYDCHSKISYSITEKVNNNNDIKHNGVRGVLQYLKIYDGVEINHMSDLPAQTGIGSSSSFIVGLLKAIDPSMTPKELATRAIFIERTLLSEPGGIQDQIWAAYGGMNSIHIDTCGNFEVKPLPVSEDFKEELFDRSCLIYTGNKRDSFDIASSHNHSSTETKNKIQRICNEAYQAFINQDIDTIAELLKYSWYEKKQISNNISNSNIDQMYDELLTHGMIGGKLLGAGGSGFIYAIFANSSMKQKYCFGHSKICINVNHTNIGSIIK